METITDSKVNEPFSEFNQPIDFWCYETIHESEDETTHESENGTKHETEDEGVDTLPITHKSRQIIDIKFETLISCFKIKPGDIIFIEGNVGSGKTSLLYQLQLEYYDMYNFIEEPIHKFDHLIKFDDSISFDKMLIKNQLPIALIIMTNILEKYKDNKINIIDRHPCSAKLFLEYYLQKHNKLNLYITELNEFTELLENLYKSLKDRNQLLIYINSNPKKCYKRCMKRGREVEKNYTEQYFIDLNNIYKSKIHSLANTNVLFLDKDK